MISTILFIKIQTVYYLHNYITNIAEALPEPRLGIASAECLQQIDQNVLWTKEKKSGGSEEDMAQFLETFFSPLTSSH